MYIDSSGGQTSPRHSQTHLQVITMTELKHYKVAYEQRLWLNGHGYKTTKHFTDLFAKDLEHAMGKWTVLCLENQSLICITEQP